MQWEIVYVFTVIGVMWKMSYILCLFAHSSLMSAFTFYPGFYENMRTFVINSHSAKDSFSKLMSTDNDNILYCLAKYINKCLKIRL